MSSQHSGNLLNQVMFEEHDGNLNAKKVSLVSSATIFAVVDLIGADSVAINGNVTLDPGSRTGIVGNLTLSDPKGFIGLVTIGNTVNTSLVGNVTLDAGSKTGITGNVTISDSKGFIGLVTVGNTVTVGAHGITGNVTLDSGSKTGIVGNVTLSDPKGFIGLVTIGGGLSNVAVVGNVTISGTPNVAVVGNVTLSDSKGYIGLVTVTQASSARTITGNITIDSGVITTITNPVALKGNVTLDVGSLVGVRGNLTLSDPKGFIGLVTVTGGVSFSGNVTLDAGSKTGIVGNVTISDSKGFIGLVTATSIQGTSPWSSSIVGNLTLSDPKGFIGLVTVTGGVSFAGNVTLDAGSKTQIVGNLTISDSKGFIGLVSVSGFANPLPVTFSGNVTLDAGSKTGIVGNVTITDSKGFIGLVTLGGGTAWTDPKGFIGLVTVVGSLSPAAGNVTLDPGSRTGLVGNVTLDPGSKTQITDGTQIANTVAGDSGQNFILAGPSQKEVSFTTTTAQAVASTDVSNYNGVAVHITSQGTSSTVTFQGSNDNANWVSVGLTTSAAAGLTVPAVSSAATGLFVGHCSFRYFRLNVTGISAGTTAGVVEFYTQAPPPNSSAMGTFVVDNADSIVQTSTANRMVNASRLYAFGNASVYDRVRSGLTSNVSTAVGILNTLPLAQYNPAASISLVSLNYNPLQLDQIGNLKTTILGNITIDSGVITTITNPVALKGNVTLDVGSLVGIRGNVTLSDSKGYVGLVTNTPAYGSNSTVLTGIISASGNTTVAVPPSNTRFFIKNIFISSLGRGEVEIRSGATTLIPFAGLSTTSGYGLHFGEQGLPGRAQNDSLVINLNGTATISYMFNVRSES